MTTRQDSATDQLVANAVELGQDSLSWRFLRFLALLAGSAVETVPQDQPDRAITGLDE